MRESLQQRSRRRLSLGSEVEAGTGIPEEAEVRQLFRMKLSLGERSRSRSRLKLRNKNSKGRAKRAKQRVRLRRRTSRTLKLIQRCRG